MLSVHLNCYMDNATIVFFIAMGIDDIDHRLHVCTGDSIHELIQEFAMSNISDHVKI